LQSILARLGYSQAVTGYFGSMTAAAVRAWEQKAGETVDGLVPEDQAKRMERWARRYVKANGGTVPESPDPQIDRPPITPPSGAPVPSVPVSTTGFVFPISGSHSFGTAINRFGAPRDGHTHQGQDVLAPMGTPLVAAHAGRVSHRGTQAAAGNYLVIEGTDGNDYVYMHLQAPATVAPGETVRAGQGVGRVGCTGSCSGPHLHFEIWVGHWYAGGHPVDPLANLRAWDTAT